jgi:hypothetical protein
LEILGEERRVSHRFPKIESLFSRAARTWPTSIFSLFSLFTPTPYNKRGIYAQPSKPQLPTPEASSDDSLPSLDTDISSSDPNDSTDATSDLDWAYPPTPPPLPSFEIPQITIQPQPTILEDPELELPALNLPLRQFEDLHVGSDAADELEKEIGERMGDNRNVPRDVDMKSVELDTHPCLTDHPTTNNDTNSNHGGEANTIPSVEVIITTPSTEEHDELDQEDPPLDNDQSEPQSPPYFDDEPRLIADHPPRTYYQGQLEAELRRILGRILAQMLPLTTLHFGSRVSYRAQHRLREVIPKHLFEMLFREYGSYAELAKSISTVREDQRNIPNRWQVHLPRLRRIRQLIVQYIHTAESLVKHHGYLDGLKEYVTQNNVEFWNTDPRGLLYYHENQYLYAFHRFLVDESYPDVALRTQRILQSTFEHSGDLWALVYTILGRLDPPSYEFELDCNFVPRTDDAANRKRAHFEQHERFP